MKSDFNMANSPNVFESPADYYNPIKKKWDSGIFTFSKNHVQFIIDSPVTSEKFHLCLPLSTITGIEKRQSNFVYPSLVICIGSEKHWFASFPSRDAVFNLLELFWREALVSRPHWKTSPPKPTKANSLLGKELLGLLTESKNTLIATANSLSDQSRQLYDAEEAVEDLNSDLTKFVEAAKNDCLTVPLVNFTNKENTVNNLTEVSSHRYKVTFSFSNNEDKMDWEKGILFISSDVISLKVEEKTAMQVTKDELDALEVLSPWEFCITHTFSGIKKSCFFMCPQLSRLLKFASSISHYKEKIYYSDDDSSGSYDTASCSSSSFGSPMNSPSSSSNKLNLPGDKSSITSQNQISTSILSEEEMNELSNTLQDLQTLAVEVGKEQENQLEKINTLVENMENTEIRMKKSSRVPKE